MSLVYYIASRGRPYCLSYHALPKEIQKRTFIVVRPDDHDSYVEEGGFKTRQLITLPKRIEGLSPTRQWIQDNADDRFIVQMDDDLRSFSKKASHKTFAKLHIMTPSELLVMDAMFFKWLKTDRYGHCGMGDRVQSSWASKPFQDNTQMARLMCYDRLAVSSVKARWDRTPLIQDKDITLQLLRCGVPNRVSLLHCYSESGMGKRKNGVALYRTGKLYDECVLNLAKLHPGLVTVKASTRDHWSFKCTVQPRVAWSKAFNYDKREQK